MKIIKYNTDILNKKYFEKEELEAVTYNNEENNIINIHPEIEYQEWNGLGGALTNSTLNNLKRLDLEKREKIINDYYNELNYNYLRLPIGTTDFSVRPYDGYDNDFKDNVEIINKIQEIKNIKIIATPWSPPKKYKSNSSLYGGKLKKEAYDDYSNYIINFINDYKFANINIDYLSIQNEPFAKQIWESCTYSIEEMRDFIYNYIIPKLKNTKIILWDHNKENLYNNFKQLYEKNEAIKGVGFHWYSGSFFKEMELIKQNYPEILLFETEMCCGFSRYNKRKWINDAEHYLTEIIGGINHGLNAFIDWNMLLNYYGGPNHKFNNCKSPIILNRRGNDFIKTPIYYYLKHIGIVNKGKVIAASKFDRVSEIEVVAIKNEKIYVTIINKGKRRKKVNLLFNGNLIKDTINKHSVSTYILGNI